MAIIRHTSMGKMFPCRSTQCKHFYTVCLVPFTAVLGTLVVLTAFLTPVVETGVCMDANVALGVYVDVGGGNVDRRVCEVV